MKRIEQEGHCDPNGPPIFYPPGDREAVALWYGKRGKTLAPDACLKWTDMFPGVVLIGDTTSGGCDFSEVLIEEVLFKSRAGANGKALRLAGWEEAEPERRKALARAWLDEAVAAFEGAQIVEREPDGLSAAAGTPFTPPRVEATPDGNVRVEAWWHGDDGAVGAGTYWRDTIVFDADARMTTNRGKPIELE